MDSGVSVELGWFSSELYMAAVPPTRSAVGPTIQVRRETGVGMKMFLPVQSLIPELACQK